MKPKIEILKSTITIGLEKPIRFLHLTDTHIAFDDPSGGRRTAYFDMDFEGSAEAYVLQAISYAKEKQMPILCTGDLIDFLSEGNFRWIEKHFNQCDYLYAAGNHDFCHYVGRATEDYAYKWEMIKRIAPYIKNNLYFDSRVIGGVNFVTLDDSYYLISDGQIEMLKAEVAKGYPIILAMHVPLYTEKHAGLVMEKNPCAYLVGAPQALLETYPEQRRLQQTPDAATSRAVEYIRNEPMIKAIIAGHTHLNLEEMVTDTLPQYTTHGSYARFVREFTVI